jgi:hypothetical protein
MTWDLKHATEYQARMHILAGEINAGKHTGNHAVGVKLDPPLVEWYAYECMKQNAEQYDGIFFFESLYGMTDKDTQWDGESLAEYLETLTREFLAEQE